MPATLELTIGGFLLSTIVAFPIGVIAATRRGTMTDGTVMLGAMLGQSMPSFLAGLDVHPVLRRHAALDAYIGPCALS